MTMDSNMLQSFLSFCYYSGIWPNHCSVSNVSANYEFERLGKKVNISFTDYLGSEIVFYGSTRDSKHSSTITTDLLLEWVEETKRFLYDS